MTLIILAGKEWHFRVGVHHLRGVITAKEAGIVIGRTNLRGPYVLSCEVARRLIAAELPGRMVNISSVGAFNYSGQGAALYSITKAGIIRMTEALAVEWARFNINVNAIAPGAFASEMMDGMLERMGDISKAFPRKRICDPAEMDSTLLYFVSPASEWVTGECISISGGGNLAGSV